MTRTVIPWSMSCFFIFSGGDASGPARSAPPTVNKVSHPTQQSNGYNCLLKTNATQKRFPLIKREELVEGNSNTDTKTHANQTIAELPSAFLVTSQQSSMPTASIGREPTPMTAIIVNKAAVLLGLTTRRNHVDHKFQVCVSKAEYIPAQIRVNHPTATKGTKTLLVAAKWWVKTRSNSGAVTIAATIPLKSKQAPIKPASSAE